jgi:hypothetical protein
MKTEQYNSSLIYPHSPPTPPLPLPLPSPLSLFSPSIPSPSAMAGTAVPLRGRGLRPRRKRQGKQREGRGGGQKEGRWVREGRTSQTAAPPVHGRSLNNLLTPQKQPHTFNFTLILLSWLYSWYTQLRRRNMLGHDQGGKGNGVH